MKNVDRHATTPTIVEVCANQPPSLNLPVVTSKGHSHLALADTELRGRWLQAKSLPCRAGPPSDVLDS